MAGYLRTGQAARQLGVTPHWIRRAARTGILESEETPSGQLRVPCEEIERLQKQKENGGLPALPADVEPDNSAPEIPNPRRSPLLGPASEDLVADTETVVSASNNLKRWKTKKEIVQVQDWFLERDAQAQDADLERERIHVRADAEREDRAAARQAEQERLEAQELRETERRSIFNSWVVRAQCLIPFNAPAAVRAAAQSAIQETLGNCDLEFGHDMTPALEATIEIALGQWRRDQATEAAIDTGVLSLPAAARGWGTEDYQDRARLAAADGIEELRDGASLAEKQSAARRAVAPIAQEFAAEQNLIAEQRVRDELVIVQWWALGLTGFTKSDYETAQQEIREALEELPLGTPLDRLRKTREQVLQGIKARAKAQTTREELGRTNDRRLEASLSHADRYISEHYQSFDQDFGNLSETQRQLRELIRPELGAELRRGELSDQEIEEFMEALIDEELYD